MIEIIKRFLIKKRLKNNFVQYSNKINSLYEYRLTEYNLLLSIIDNYADGTEEKEYLLRAGLLSLYSNWEGFINEILMIYLELVSGLKFSYYSIELQSLYLANKTSLKLTKKQSGKELDIVEGILKIPNIFELELSETILNVILGNDICSFTKNLIDTESNLNFKVLKKNLKKIGISDMDIENLKTQIENMKFKNHDKSAQDFLDDLLDERNNIAHGSKSKVKYNDLKQYHQSVLSLFDQIKRILLKSFSDNEFIKKQIQ